MFDIFSLFFYDSQDVTTIKFYSEYEKNICYQRLSCGNDDMDAYNWTRGLVTA